MAPRLIISLDFELHWGVYDKRPLDSYRANLEGTRCAIDAILERFEKWELAATWAVVGLLMCENVDDARQYEPELRGPEGPFNPWTFLRQIRSEDAHLYFAPETVAAIAAHERQEVGTHTMGHIFALEEGVSDDVFRADLEAAKKVAHARGYDLRSIVFPRNQYRENTLQVCEQAGISAYRGQPNLPWYAPRRDAAQSLVVRAARLADSYVPLSELATRSNVNAAAHPEEHACANVPASFFVRPFSKRSAALEPLRTRRILAAMRRAAATGRDIHLWWHPHNFGANLDENLTILDAIGAQYQMLAARYGMKSATMGEVAQQRSAASAS